MNFISEDIFYLKFPFLNYLYIYIYISWYRDFFSQQGVAQTSMRILSGWCPWSSAPIPEDLMSLRHNNSLSQCPEISPVPGAGGRGDRRMAAARLDEKNAVWQSLLRAMELGN